MEARRSLSIVALLFASACSGATSTELFGPPTQESNPAEPIGGDGTSGDGAGSSSSSSSSSGGGSSSSSTGGTGTSGGSNGNTGNGADAGTPPPPADACIVETEPNNTIESTEWFTKCFSGSVKKGDRDFASVSVPATAKRIEIDHEETGGDVNYRLYINGVVYDTFSDEPPRFVPIFAGATYAFEIFPAGSSPAARTYKLEVTFE